MTEGSSSFMLQKEEYDCSPTSIYNALVWSDSNPTLDTYNKLVKLCKTDKDGSSIEDVNKAIMWASKNYNFTFRLEGNPSTKRITDHIKSGGAIILGHKLPWEDSFTEHHSFWFECVKNKILGTNVKWKHPYSWITVKELKKITKEDITEVWFLTKREIEKDTEEVS